MLHLRKRPFLPIFFLLILGIRIAAIWPSVMLGSYCFFALFASWLIVERMGSGQGQTLLYITILCVGYFLGATLYKDWIYNDETIPLTGMVIETRTLSGYQRVIVKAPEVRSQLALHVPTSIAISRGDWLAFEGAVQRADRARNVGEFCYRTYLTSQGVLGVVEPVFLTKLDKQTTWVKTIDKLRSYIANNIESHIENPELVLALVLGERSYFQPSTHQLWERLGVNHLFAISGMHIGLLASLFWLVCRLLPINQAWKSVIVATFLGVYVLISGGRPSAWRAWLAVVVALLGSHTRYKDGLHIWSLVGTIMLLAAPVLVYQIGFQLSFVASGGILLWVPILQKQCAPLGTIWGKLLGKILLCLGVSVIAQLSLIPLLVYYFQQVTPSAPIATLLLLPAVFLILLGGVVLGLAGSIVAPLGFVLNWVVVVTEQVGQMVAVWAPVWRVTTLAWDVTFVWYFLYIGLGCVGRVSYLFAGRQRYVRWMLVGLCLVALMSLPVTIRRPLEVTVLDVGQGDAIYIRTPYNQHILVDGGGDSVYWQQRGRNVGLQRVVPYLQQRGVNTLDLVILTHPHEDHLHGLLAVLEHFHVNKIVDNGMSHTTNSYQRYLELVLEKEIPYYKGRAGDRIQFQGNIGIDILHPDTILVGTRCDFNNNSIVFRLDYQNRTLLFTGDLDQEGQLDLVSRVNPRADWIKIPHHGSRSAWSSEFFQAVEAKYGVISVGRNSFGHPHPQVLAGLDELEVEVFRTDIDGAVSFYVWNGILGRYATAR